MDKATWENIKTPEEKMMDVLLKKTPEDAAGLSLEELADAIATLPAIKAKRKMTYEKEERRAKAVRESAVLPQQQIAAKKAAEKAKQEARDAEVRKRLEATREEDERKVAEQKENLRLKKISDAEREKRRKSELREWNKQSKARAALRKQEGTEEKRRKEASRASQVQAVIGQVNRVLSDADALHASLKSFHRLHSNTAEQKQLKTALREASVRFAEQASKL